MATADRLRYYAFWGGFYTSGAPKLKAFFEELLRPTNQSCDIHSVFHVNTKPLRDGTEGSGRVVAQYSGEPFYDFTDKFDLNLIMEPDDKAKRIVWCPLFSIGSYENNYWPRYSVPRVLTPKKRFCAFIVSNPRAEIRNRFFEKLSEYKHVDSCGLAMNNCGFTAPFDGYLEFLSQFKFMICFENTSSSHYITEKLHNAYLGGTIPIYWGCTNAKTWLNPNAFLQLEDDSEAGMDRLIERIIELDQDDTKYAAMHAELLLPNGEIPYEMRMETMQAKIVDIVGDGSVTSSG